mgnify:CR=1 FL=1
MTINIEYETDKKLDLDYEKIINEVVNEAAAYEKCPYEIEVNVTLTDNEAIHQINKEFREVDAPTDVLSFPMINYEAPSLSHLKTNLRITQRTILIRIQVNLCLVI